MSLLFLIQLFIFKVCLYSYAYIFSIVLLLHFTEVFHGVHLPCLFIYLPVSPLWKTKLHQTLCSHKQCFDKYLFICTCHNIYFCRIFLGFVSRRQITHSLCICILNFSNAFQNAFPGIFPLVPAGPCLCLRPS